MTHRDCAEWSSGMTLTSSMEISISQRKWSETKTNYGIYHDNMRLRHEHQECRKTKKREEADCLIRTADRTEVRDSGQDPKAAYYNADETEKSLNLKQKRP